MAYKHWSGLKSVGKHSNFEANSSQQMLKRSFSWRPKSSGVYSTSIKPELQTTTTRDDSWAPITIIWC